MRSIHGTTRQTRGFLLIQKARNDLFRARFLGCGDHANQKALSIEINAFSAFIQHPMSSTCPSNFSIALLCILSNTSA